jgi:hypothetical protein
LLNPANASILKNRLDVGTYRNPLGASSVIVAVPFPVINGKKSGLVFSLKTIVGKVTVRTSGAFKVIA